MEDGVICCDHVSRTDNCNQNCNLRLLYFLQPYGSNAANVTLVPMEPLLNDLIFFREGPNIFRHNRSNPFTARLKIWTVRPLFILVNRTITDDYIT